MRGGRTMERDVAVERRREVEKAMVHEGQELWRRQKEQQRQQQLQEQRELQHMLAHYSPWGKPGCGAPNADSIRKRKMQLEGLYPDGDKGRNALALGRPGHGAPQRTRSGQVSAAMRSDAQLLFQANEPGRRCVDNVLRYRQPLQQQQAYRKELDAMVVERRRAKEEEERNCAERERIRGWSDETTLRALANRKVPVEVPTEAEGGVELVPLLARRRAPASERHPLSSTDVTRTRTDSPTVSA